MSLVTVILHRGGDAKTLDAQSGDSLKDLLKSAGLPLLAVCGGKGACGTCRVMILAAWEALLPLASPREQRLLTHLKAGPGERLSCQIRLGEELDGIAVFALDSTVAKEINHV